MPQKAKPQPPIDPNSPPGARASKAVRRQKFAAKKKHKSSTVQPTRIVELEETPDGDWVSVVKGQDVASNSKTVRVPWGIPRHKRSALLEKAGFLDAPLERIKEQLANPSVKAALPRTKLVDRPGWHKVGSNELHYLFPNEPSVEAPDNFDKIVFRGPEVESIQTQPTGTDKSWKKYVARPMAKSPAGTLAMGVGFGALILGFAPITNYTVQFTGPQKVGKTFLTEVATSVAGFIPRNSGMHTWNATDLAVEEAAAGRNDNIFCIDELALADDQTKNATQKMLGNVFRLASGQTKRRSKHTQNAHATDGQSYRTIIVTSGVESIFDRAAAAGIDIDRGETVRWAAVPVLAPESETIFTELPEPANSAPEAIQLIRTACHSHSGTVGREFVAKAAGDKNLDAKIADYMRKFRIKAGMDSDGEDREFCNMFALPYAALMLAIDWQLFPELPNRVRNQLVELCERTRTELPPAEITVEEDFSALKEALRDQEQITRLLYDGNKVIFEEPEKSLSAFALIETTKKGLELALIPRVKLEELVGSADHADRLAEHLEHLNLLKLMPKTDNRRVYGKQISGERGYYYSVLLKRLMDV